MMTTQPTNQPQLTSQPQPVQKSSFAEHIARAKTDLNALRATIGSVVIGQSVVIDKLIICLLAGGHVLLEGVPGLGKTLLVKALSKAVSGQFGRIQFTPDLMPSDVVGHTLYDMQTGQWKTRKGAVFCNLLLADEINRATAKTQSALLEVMQEGQATIEGTTHAMPTPFICVATQNPLEQEGTYPLPEAQLDRFLMNIFMDYPSYDDEKRMILQETTGRVGDKLDLSKVESVMSPERLLQLQKLTAHIQVSERVADYAVQIVRGSRNFVGIEVGAGSRAGMALIRAGKGSALLAGREYVVPEDIRQVATDVLRHRIRLTADFMIDGYQVADVIGNLVASVNAPRT